MFTLYKKREFLFERTDRLDSVSCVIDKTDDDKISIDISICDTGDVVNFFDLCEGEELEEYYKAFCKLKSVFENICDVLKKELDG